MRNQYKILQEKYETQILKEEGGFQQALEGLLALGAVNVIYQVANYLRDKINHARMRQIIRDSLAEVSDSKQLMKFMEEVLKCDIDPEILLDELERVKDDLSKKDIDVNITRKKL